MPYKDGIFHCMFARYCVCVCGWEWYACGLVWRYGWCMVLHIPCLCWWYFDLFSHKLTTNHHLWRICNRRCNKELQIHPHFSKLTTAPSGTSSSAQDRHAWKFHVTWMHYESSKQKSISHSVGTWFPVIRHVHCVHTQTHMCEKLTHANALCECTSPYTGPHEPKAICFSFFFRPTFL